MYLPTMSFPLPIITPNLIIRQPNRNSNDANEYVEAIETSFGELRPWLAWAQYCPTAGQAEEYIRECCNNWITKSNNNIGLSLWIIDRHTNKFVGHIVLWNIAWDVPKFEIGFWLRTSETHKGYITEATNALTQYCFLQLQARRVEIRCEIENIRSQLVPQRLGFQLEGILRNNCLSVRNREPTNILVFSRIDMNDLPILKVSWNQT